VAPATAFPFAEDADSKNYRFSIKNTGNAPGLSYMIIDKTAEEPKMAFTTEDMILIEQRAANEKKSAGAAYLLWFFLGWISAHRFYLGKPVTAILQIVSYFFLIGFVWWVLDLFLIPAIIDQKMDAARSDAAWAIRRSRYA